MSPGLFRFLLSFVVVFHHSFPIRLGSWAVAMFFVLSGYWISKLWREKYSRTPSPYTTFLISRWLRLAPLFVAVQLIAILVYASGILSVQTAFLEDMRWWITQPIVAGSTQFGRLLPPAWSLDVEMQFYVLAPLFIIGLTQLETTGSTILLVLLGLWQFLLLSAGVGMETNRLDLYAWLFAVGLISQRYDWRPSLTLQRASLSALIGFLLLAVLFSSTRSLVWQVGSSVSNGPENQSSLFFVLIVLAGIPTAISTVHRPSGSWDRWFGDLSYPLYLIHWLPRDWYYSQVDWRQGAWWNGCLLLSNFLLATSLAVLLLHRVDRPVQAMRQRWLAKRCSKPRTVSES